MSCLLLKTKHQTTPMYKLATSPYTKLRIFALILSIEICICSRWGGGGARPGAGYSLCFSPGYFAGVQGLYWINVCDPPLPVICLPCDFVFHCQTHVCVHKTSVELSNVNIGLMEVTAELNFGNYHTPSSSLLINQHAIPTKDAKISRKA